MVVVVPIGDLRLLEEFEDWIDLKDARKALAEMRKNGVKPVPLHKIRKELGLK